MIVKDLTTSLLIAPKYWQRQSKTKFSKIYFGEEIEFVRVKTYQSYMLRNLFGIIDIDSVVLALSDVVVQRPPLAEPGHDGQVGRFHT